MNANTTTLPENTETLKNLRTENQPKPFNETKFREGFKQHAKEANQLFDAAFANVFPQ